MKRLKLFILFFSLLVPFALVGQASKFFMGYKLTESVVTDYKDGFFCKAIVNLDSIQRCQVLYGVGTQAESINYQQQIETIEWITQSGPSQNNSTLYHGKATDGTYFIEKVFHDRPSKEGILFYKIPEMHYAELQQRLDKVSYLPLELFRDSLITLMGYKFTGAYVDSYEEGRDGAALVNINRGQICHAYYFNGAMMGLPLYYNNIDKIEYVHMVDSSQNEGRYYSPTGIIYHGKAANGTYFVEKIFYNNLQGMPQGIILYAIPAECYENVLLRLCSLPNLSSEMFGTEKLQNL